MIKLTPIEIERHEFKTVWRGYDPIEVRAFLSQISHEITGLLRSQERIQDELEVKAQRLNQVEDYETKLRDALLAASQLAEQTREEARKEAELLVKEAELRADELLKGGRQATRDLHNQIEALKRQRERLSIELRSVVESHLRMLENQEEHLSQSKAHWDELRDRELAPIDFDENRSSREDEQDALLEARELTLALGTEFGGADLESALSSTQSKSALLTPTLPEPLATSPLGSSRLRESALTQNPVSQQELEPKRDESGDLTSGIAKLQRVLSVTPRRVAPEREKGKSEPST